MENGEWDGDGDGEAGGWEMRGEREEERRSKGKASQGKESLKDNAARVLPILGGDGNTWSRAARLINTIHRLVVRKSKRIFLVTESISMARSRRKEQRWNSRWRDCHTCCNQHDCASIAG